MKLTDKQRKEIKDVLYLFKNYNRGYNICDVKTDEPICYDEHLTLRKIEEILK